MNAEEKQKTWCKRFARLYQTRTRCDAETAAKVAEIAYPALGLTAPAEAVDVVMSDPSLAAAFRNRFPPPDD